MVFLCPFKTTSVYEAETNIYAVIKQKANIIQL